MTGVHPIRLFVVDDHPVVRMGVKTMFESVSGFVVVGTAASGREALKLSPDWTWIQGDKTIYKISLLELATGNCYLEKIPCSFELRWTVTAG